MDVETLAEFASDVRSGEFPNMAESYRLDDGVVDALGLYGAA